LKLAAKDPNFKGFVTVVNTIKKDFMIELKSVADNDDLSLLLRMVKLWVILSAMADACKIESTELNKVAGEVEEMIREVCNCNSFDKPEIIRAVLFNGIDQPVGEIPGLDEIYWSKDKDKYLSIWKKRCDYWLLSRLLSEDNVLNLCCTYKLKSIFATSQVSSIMDQLFKGHHLIWGSNIPDLILSRRHSGKFVYQLDVMSKLGEIYSSLTYARYCPAMMYILEGLSKLLVLVLVSLLSISVYNSNEGIGTGISTEEAFLVMMTITSLLYELGQIIQVRQSGVSMKDSVKAHFCEIWNITDGAAIALLIIWTVLLPVKTQFIAGRIALSLSAIPLAVSLMQYVAFRREFGQLVLMIFAMTQDLLWFGVVYVIILLGFLIFFTGLFAEAVGFRNNWSSILTLFSSSLGNFDFEDFHGLANARLGKVVLVVYVTMMAILLLNLLIARMSATHQRINDKALEEFSYLKVRYLF
jgi:hypothetical protein